MAPSPIIALLVVSRVPELAIVSVPLAQIDPVVPVFAVIPFMIVTMIAIVIAWGRDNHFLRCCGFGCYRGRECGRHESKTQDSVC